MGWPGDPSVTPGLVHGTERPVQCGAERPGAPLLVSKMLPALLRWLRGGGRVGHASSGLEFSFVERVSEIKITLHFSFKAGITSMTNINWQFYIGWARKACKEL